MESLPNEERGLFLAFAWGRRRMPSQVRGWKMEGREGKGREGGRDRRDKEREREREREREGGGEIAGVQCVSAALGIRAAFPRHDSCLVTLSLVDSVVV